MAWQTSRSPGPNGSGHLPKWVPCHQNPIDRDRRSAEANATTVSSLGAFPTPTATPGGNVTAEGRPKTFPKADSWNFLIHGTYRCQRARAVHGINSRQSSGHREHEIAPPRICSHVGNNARHGLRTDVSAPRDLPTLLLASSLTGHLGFAKPNAGPL